MNMACTEAIPIPKNTKCIMVISLFDLLLGAKVKVD
jgi:hypothetical protein